jgi:nucleoside-diphosphate-sugar epimerase
MNILLIGGNGFIGSGIARYFVERGGHRVASVARQSRPALAAVDSIEADRASAASFAAAIGARTFDIAVDLTAYQTPELDAVLSSLAGRVGHFFFISTDFVYANDIEQLPIREDAPKDPDSAYGQGKLACEARLREWFEKRQFVFTALRPPHVIGAGKELGSGSVQGRDRNLLRSMRAGTGLTLIADGMPIIMPVWHQQIAAAIEACAGKPATFGQSMNMSGGDVVTTRRYYQMIADILGVPLRYDSISLDAYRRQYPASRAFARHRLNDMSKLKSLAGFEPGAKLAEALRETVQWMEARC